MKYYFTSDWHVGEAQTPNTHSFLRPRPTEVMAEEWLADLTSKITPEDALVFVGDLGIQLSDSDFFKRLPECKKILVLGDKEYANKNFTQEAIVEHVMKEKIFDVVHLRSMVIVINDIEFIVAHKPSDCFGQGLPAICGHVHGIWRSAEMVDKRPIINVGVDVWGGLVSEEFIIHQYNAITKFYDDEAFPNRWDTKVDIEYPGYSTEEIKKVFGHVIVSEQSNVYTNGDFLKLNNGQTKLLAKGDLISMWKSGRVEYIPHYERQFIKA